jgi:endo-1,3-1,4-beta-glycanase ExoK
MIRPTSLFRTLAAVNAVSFVSWPAQAQEATTYDASFFEAFNELDLETRWLASDGWTNGEHQGCEWRKENLAVEDGRLTLSIKSNPRTQQGTCAELQSRGIYGFGTYEASVRPVSASGTVSAFFTYIGPVHGQPHDEIDFEFLGRDTSTLQLNYFVNGEGNHEIFVPSGEGDADGFIQLSFEWTADIIRWYVDRRLVAETGPGDTIPTVPSRIYLSFWNGTDTVLDWLGAFDSGTEPAAMEVKWIAFTAPEDRCSFPASLTCDTAITD